MINVSNEFRKLMNTRTDFKQNAEITFANGVVETLVEKDFTVSNNSLVDASGTNGIPLGVAVCRSIQIELMNDDDRFSTYDFFGARIRLFLTFQLSETVERIEYGTFTVLTPETYGETVIITALDDMYKADRAYTTTIPFPATVGTLLRDACGTLEISQGTTTFLNDDFVVNAMPENITFRQMFGYIAMIAGGNIRIDTTGRLRVITYDFATIDEIRDTMINGGAYRPWNNPVDLDGGDFTYNTGDVVDGGLFTDRPGYHLLSNWSNLKIDTDDVVITGVSAVYEGEDNEEHTVIYGTEGYVLNIDNPLIEGRESEAVALIGNVMVGARFRQFSGDLISDPTCEFMDAALIIDRKGNLYTSFLTDINFQFFGYTTIKNSAEPALRNSSKTYSDATQTLVAARKLIKKERTARELAVAQLAKDLSNSSGLFMTQEEQKDGSIIYYMHDKASLEESMIIWKLTALAFGISTDGGKTYPYGFTVDGTTITRLLYAEGIDADYIDTGALRIVDHTGKNVFYADFDTKQVEINADNVFVGSHTITEYMDNEVDEKLKDYSTTVEMQSAINISAAKIEQNVSETYETKGNASNYYKKLESSITQTANNIESKVSKTEYDGKTITSLINQSASTVMIEASHINLNGAVTANNYFKVLMDGSVDIIGGTIAGFYISESKLESYVTEGDIEIHVGIGKYGEEWALFAGKKLSYNNTYEFCVGHDGTVYADMLYSRTYVRSENGFSVVKWDSEISAEKTGVNIGIGNIITNTYYGWINLYYDGEIRTSIWADEWGMAFKTPNGEINFYEPDIGSGRCNFNLEVEMRNTVYDASGSTVISSDKNLKNSIESLDLEKTADFIYSLNPCKFKYNIGTSGRFHHGLIAQEVKESMRDEDWGLYVEYQSKDGLKRGLRDTELIADLIATVQTLNKRIEALERGECNG